MSKKLSIAETNKHKINFISSACKIHKNKYDYGEVNYINSKTHVNILCGKHGTFKQIPNSHLNGQGCPGCKCEKIKKLNAIKNNNDIDERRKNFIKKALNKHDKKYDYSLAKYLNAFTTIDIICTEHGIFKQSPNNHLAGHGCPACGKNRLTGGYSEEIFEIMPMLKTKLGYLYTATILDKEQKNAPKFIKIGITVTKPKYRLSKIKKDNFQILEINEYPMSIYEAFSVEQKVLKLYKSERFFPCRKFNGYTECLKYNILCDIEATIKAQII